MPAVGGVETPSGSAEPDRDASTDGAELKRLLLPPVATIAHVAAVISVVNAAQTHAWVKAGGGHTPPEDAPPFNMSRPAVWFLTAVLGGWLCWVAATRRAPLWSAEG
eukprot:gene22020-4576_t